MLFWVSISFFIAIILLLSMYIQSYRYTIRQMPLFIKELPQVFDGLNILFISDIHRRKIPKTLIDKAKALTGIDYVFIGGDIVEEGVSLQQVKENVIRLSKIAPSYFVWGNHDVKSDRDALQKILQSEGVTILENEASLLRHLENERLWLIGIGDVCSKEDRIEQALHSIDEHNDGFRLMLCHVPTITRKIKPEHKIALVLSGHTHAGQISFPFIGPVTGSVGQLFPKQVEGLHDLETTKLYISSGFGTSHLPLRLFTTPEIVIFTLRCYS